MRRVGHEAAALLLRGVESFGQEVELLAEVGYLVAPAGDEPVTVIPARNDFYRAHKLAHTAEQQRCEQSRHKQRAGADDKRYRPDAGLDADDYLRPLRVVLIDVQRAHGRALPVNGHRVAAGKSFAGEQRAENAFPGEREEQLLNVGVLIDGAPVVIQDEPVLVGYYRAGIAADIENTQYLRNALLRQPVKPRKRRGDDRRLTGHGAVLLFKDHVS